MEHSAILFNLHLVVIKLPVVIKTFVLSIFEWLFYTGFTIQKKIRNALNLHKKNICFHILTSQSD